MIRACEVVRRYGDFVAVDGVSFEINPGEIVGLLGHNGAGKTTLMKMLTGFIEPDAGTIEINGKSVVECTAEIQEVIGYLPESSPLYPEMLVAEYLEYVCELRGIPQSERSAKVRTAIERTRLQEKIMAPISTLSRGYRQRVGVAQALLHDPAILILDEPTNGLDPSQIQDMRSLIKDLSAHATIILSTHILQEVRALCDRVIVIQNGSVAVDSTLAALQEARTLSVSIDKGPEEVCPTLGTVTGVGGVTVSAEAGSEHVHTYFITMAEGTNPEACAPEIARLVVESGWQLHALQSEQRSLESVFKNLETTRPAKALAA